MARPVPGKPSNVWPCSHINYRLSWILKTNFSSRPRTMCPCYYTCFSLSPVFFWVCRKKNSTLHFYFVALHLWTICPYIIINKCVFLYFTRKLCVLFSAHIFILLLYIYKIMILVFDLPYDKCIFCFNPLTNILKTLPIMWPVICPVGPPNERWKPIQFLVRSVG